jgi:DNA repair protein RecN (Recombination protein N)
LANELEKKTISVFKELGLSNGIFEIRISKRENKQGPIQVDGKNYALNPEGIDQVEYYISLNPGEAPKPLIKIASGGEISRIMLALKTALAEADAIPVLIFDEIDTGISGRIAQMVGKNLKEVSKRHQVLCITHLPLIASSGDHHFSVVKEINQNRSVTKIKPLNMEKRIHEIAKLIGGENVTESTLKNARELLKV